MKMLLLHSMQKLVIDKQQGFTSILGLRAHLNPIELPFQHSMIYKLA